MEGRDDDRFRVLDLKREMIRVWIRRFFATGSGGRPRATLIQSGVDEQANGIKSRRGDQDTAGAGDRLMIAETRAGFLVSSCDGRLSAGGNRKAPAVFEYQQVFRAVSYLPEARGKYP